MREVASGQGATRAWPTGPTGRPSGRGPAVKGGAEWPVGERKWRWATDGPKTEAGPNTSNKPFQFFFEIQIFLTTLEICARRFRRDFGMGIFSKFF
jgi:hypothetical protein